MIFRILQMTCPRCGHVQRARCRELGDTQVLPPCEACGIARGAGTNVEPVGPSYQSA